MKDRNVTIDDLLNLVYILPATIRNSSFSFSTNEKISSLCNFNHREHIGTQSYFVIN